MSVSHEGSAARPYLATSRSKALAGESRHIVVMGVSGSGKTTLARGISAATGFVFAEADDFHSSASIEKMTAGKPLTDDDRWPWLRDLAKWIADRAAEGLSTVVSCSALKCAYRDVLDSGTPSLEFIHLDAPTDVLRRRMSARSGHYMPASLLDSQVATLEPLRPGEHGFVIDATLPSDQLVAAAIATLQLRRSLGS